MNNKIEKNQKGQTLPLTLVLVGTLTATVAIVGYSIVTERKFIFEDKKRIDSTLAAESAQQYGKAYVNDFLTTNLGTYVNTTLGMTNTNVSNCLLGDTDAKRNGLFNGTVSPLPVFAGLGTSTAEQEFMVFIKNKDQVSVVNNKIRNPIKYRTYFFDDLDEDENKDGNEQGFKWLRFVTNSDGTQTNFYSYVMTTYGYLPVGNGKFIKKKAVSRGTMSFIIGNDTFAKYSLFTNTHLSESGGQIWFTGSTNFKGPVHTNGQGGSAFNFLGNPSGSFSGDVTSAATNVRWNNNNSPFLQNLGTGTTANPKNGTKDVPSFAKGLKTGVGTINLPPNSLSQEKAAMGGDPTNTTALTTSQKATLLGLPATSTSIPNGIYLPKDSSGTTTTGGIYVQGNLDSLTMSLDDSDPLNVKQKYYLVQGSSRKYITIDRVNNTTKIQDANSSGTPTGTPATYSGVPKGTIHVSGAINSLGGPARTTASNPSTAGPAIAKDNALTISASGDIIVQRDIKYEKDPRGADGVFDTPDDDLDAKNLLGLFSSGGDVRVGSSMPNNATLHSTVMASASGGVFKVDGHDSGAHRGIFNLLGGVITDRYGAFGTTSPTGFSRNFEYDIRMEKKRMSPPFFPTMTAFQIQGDSNYVLDDWNEASVNK